MALKTKVTAAEYAELSEAHQELYVEDGDEYKLDLEGDPPGDGKTAKLNALLKKSQKATSDLKAQLAAESEKLTEAEKALEEAKEAGGAKDDLAAQVAKLNKDLATEREKREASEAAVARSKFESMARKAAVAAGISGQAIPDVLTHLRTQRGMKLVENEILDGEGTTLTEALDSMRKEQPYFFKESKGGKTPPGKKTPPVPDKTVTHADLSTPEGRKALREGKAVYEPPADD